MLVTESMELPLCCFLHDIYFRKYVHIILFLHDIDLFFFWCSHDYMNDDYYDRITEINLFNAFKVFPELLVLRNISGLSLFPPGTTDTPGDVQLPVLWM